MKKIYLTMPQPGETISEGVVVQWFKNPGDEITEGEAVCELETEKAVFAYESPFAGKILSHLVQVGTSIPVGKEIAVLEVSEEKAKQYTLLGIAKIAQDSLQTDQAEKVIKQEEDKKEDSDGDLVSEKFLEIGDIKMSPYVRRRAREKNLSVDALVSLANESGRVTAAAIDGSEGKNSTKSFYPSYRSQPCSPIRMRIAEKMVYSKTHIPHAHTGLAIDMTGLLQKRAALKDKFIQDTGKSPSLLTLMLPVLVDTIKKHPLVNASYGDECRPHEIRIFNQINLGIAIGSPHGLVTPAIHGADQMGESDFNTLLHEIVTQAEMRQLKPEWMTGMTFLFNNFGFFGTTSGVQVIAHPLSSTLGMGKIEKRVVPLGDDVKIRDMADFFLAFDHRVMDGREAGMFLNDLRKALETV